jgi:hypothetical protein
MATYLVMPRNAYRATIEEQDDPALWFAHAMKKAGAHVAVLLRGDTVNYAVRGQDARGLAFGRRAVKGSDIARDVSALVEADVSVHAVAEDLTERGVASGSLIAGVKLVSQAKLAELVAGFDRAFAF